MDPILDDILQRNNKGFPWGTGLLYYSEKETFNASIRYVFLKNTKHKISYVKTFFSVHMKPWPLNAGQNFKMKSVIALV